MLTETILTLIIISFLLIVIIYRFIKFALIIPHPSQEFKCTSDIECSNGKCLNGICNCNLGWEGIQCNIYSPFGMSNKCDQIPKKCEVNEDCASCVIESTCEDVSKIKNKFNLKGKYCMPIKPQNKCNEDNGGVWVWSGWENIEGMGWRCECQYQDAFGGPSCNDQFICKGGKLGEVTPDKNPFNRKCECKNITCTKNEDCVYGPCINGICVGQRLGLSDGTQPPCQKDQDCEYGECINNLCEAIPSLGYNVTPSCIKDSCYPGGQWDEGINKCKCDRNYKNVGNICCKDKNTDCVQDSECCLGLSCKNKKCN